MTGYEYRKKNGEMKLHTKF